MERLERLITTLRNQTHSTDYDESNGVLDATIIQYFNDAHQNLRGIVFGTGPDQYLKTALINTVAGTESYPLPDDSFLGSSVVSVEYKYGTDTGQYARMSKKSLHTRHSADRGTPSSYIPFATGLLLSPVPDKSVVGGLRITYEPLLSTLDIRRGVVASCSISNDLLVSITCDLSPSLSKDVAVPTAGAIELVATDFISVVDRDGVILLSEIPVDSYDTVTGVITISGPFDLTSAEAAVQIPSGSYVVSGRYASSHSPFPDFCTSFLIAYAKYLVCREIGNADQISAQADIQALAQVITETFSNLNIDTFEIPLTNRRDSLI